jgi:hypothetical protein
MSKEPSAAEKLFGDFAPKLVESAPLLSKADRSAAIIRITCLKTQALNPGLPSSRIAGGRRSLRGKNSKSNGTSANGPRRTAPKMPKKRKNFRNNHLHARCDKTATLRPFSNAMTSKSSKAITLFPLSRMAR